MELQLILEDMLTLKAILHKFYDITRTDFGSQRAELLNTLKQMDFVRVDSASEKDKKDPIFLENNLVLIYLIQMETF